MNSTQLERALARAPDRPQADQSRRDREFFCFRIGELALGVPSENVREVVRLGPMTPLPRSPSFLLGVCGHRGEVLPVVDLLRYLGKGEAKTTTRTRLFVGIAERFHVGFLADAVTGLERVQLADIRPPPMAGDWANEHVLGVVMRPQGTLALLDLAKLLTAARARVVAR